MGFPIVPRPRVVVLQMDGSSPAGAPSAGDNARWFSTALERAGAQPFVVRAFAGERLPASLREHTAKGAVGIIGTGGGGFVTDRAPWLMHAGADMLEAAERYPVLGVCLSAQLLAQELGGTVDFVPSGLESGTQHVQLRGEDPLFAGLPRRLDVQESHLQHVAELPPGAFTLASNETSPVQAWGYGDNVRATQFHPEMPLAAAEAYAAKGNPAPVVRDTPEAAQVIDNWVNNFVLRKG